MANDSTTAGAMPAEHGATPTNDHIFTDMQGEDAFFGPEQLAQASEKVVPVPPDQNVIRVQVNPGEVIELSSPFDPGAALLGREADGNLAIKVGDVTVILQGFVDANAQAPVVIQTSDGQPIDIAILLASTDPAIDIQTAAGPGDAGQGGQGADNTGGILAQFANGNGLGGLNAVGAQDQTQLAYGLIDNSIRLDREDALLASSAGQFPGVAEPFLRDPAHNNSASWLSFDDFKTEYAQYIDDHKATKGGWADFTGTQATDSDSAAFFLDTSFVVEVPHSSTNPEQLNLLVGPGFFSDDVPTSNDETLVAEYLGGAPGDKSTIVLVRPSDGAVIMVFHVVEAESTGTFHVEVYLVNRLDHHTEGQDVLSIGFNTEIFTPSGESEGSQETPGTTQPGPSASVDILDDVPVARDVAYTSYLGKDAPSEDDGYHHHDSKDTTADGKAFADEDWVKSGNKDYDNNPSGANSDAAHGDDIGRAVVKGNLKIDFGADGPSGADGNDLTFTLGSDSTLVLKLDTSEEAGFVDANGHVLDAQGNVITSHGHELVILSDTVDANGVEHLVVGYTEEKPTETSDLVFATESEGGSCDVAVFELTLDLNPDDLTGSGMHFQDFKFELYKALDQDPNTPTIESNTDLQFKVVGHDDDGDPVHSAINIQVNDDSPVFKITYDNEDPQHCAPGEVPADARALLVGGGDVIVEHYTTTDFGHVDEDWLQGDRAKKSLVAFSAGNQDLDGNGNDNANLYGDDKGGLEVCGQIKVKYGADGPSDAEDNGNLALTKYDASDFANPPLFVNGDPAHSHLTSGGQDLVVLESSEGHLVVGLAGQVLPGEGEGGSVLIIPGQIIFSLDLNPDTGKFDFQLFGPIDHVPATVDGQPESNLVLSFDVGFAEDFDLDRVLGQINIKVNDDKPEVGISYYNELPIDYGEGIGISHRTDIDTGRVDEDWLSATYDGNKDQDANGVSNGNLFGDDDGSTHLSGQIAMKYGADGPGTQFIGLAAIAAATDAAGNALTTQNKAISLVVLQSDAEEIRIGYSDADGEHTVFQLTLDSTGHFDFTQFEPIDHPVASPTEDNVVLAFKAGSITDGDGDTTDAIIKIQVNDDTPETGISYTSVVPEVPVDTDTFITFGAPVLQYGRIDEDYLGDGNKDADNDPSGSPSDPLRGDQDGYTVVTGAIDGPTQYGADGPDGTPADAYALSGLDVDKAFADAEGNPLTSHGHELVVLTSEDGKLEVGYHNDSDPDTVVFTLEMTGDTTFKFELKGPLDHPQPEEGTAEQDIVLAFGADNGTTDKDYDPSARIVIHVNDDAPKIMGAAYSYIVDEDWIHAPKVANGSFEDPKVDGTFITLPAGSDQLNGWTIGGASVDHIGTYWNASDGSQSLDMSATNAGSISKELTGLTTGQTYTIYFDLAGNPDGGDQTVFLKVEAGATAQLYSFDTKDHSHTKMGWTQETFTFIATGTSQVLTFTSQETGAVGPALDNVRLVPGAPGSGNQDTDNAVAGSASDAARGDTVGSNTASGHLDVNFGADGPGATSFSVGDYSKGETFTDAANRSFKSHDHDLKVMEADAGHVTVGYDKTTVFTFSIDDDGKFSLVFEQPLDHDSKAKLLEDSLDLSFKVTATDFDGDSVGYQLDFVVNDDAPSQGTVSYSEGEYLPSQDFRYGAIDEDRISIEKPFGTDIIGNEDQDQTFNGYPTDPNYDGPGEGSVDFQVKVAFGADGPKDHPYSLEIENEGQTYIDANGQALHSQFDPDALVVISSSEDKLVVGHKDAFKPNSTVDPLFYAVFTVTLDRDTGKGTMTLNQGIDQQENKDEFGRLTNETSLFVGFNVIAEDFDGDKLTTKVNVKINDDRPWAQDDEAPAITSDHLQVIGNVLTGAFDETHAGFDTGNADGLKVISVGGSAMNEEIGTVKINFEYGTLTVAEDGLYNFTANKNNGSSETFWSIQYQAVDGDGDKSTAYLTIHIPAFEPARGQVAYSEAESLPDSNGNYQSWGSVDEDWVPGGNQDKDGSAQSTDGPGKDSVTATVTVDFGVDGPAAHPYSFYVRDVGDEFRESLHGGLISSQFDDKALVVIKSTESELVVGHEAGKMPVFTLTLDQDTGVATLKMLQGIQSFPGGDNKESGATLGFSVIATDANGDTSSTQIKFRVNDDRPTPTPDDGYVPAYIPNDNSDPISVGNLFTNDLGKGDGLRVTNFGGVDMPPSGTFVFDAKDLDGHVYGQVIIEANGLWNFKSNKTNDAEISFLYDYSGKDGDGDTFSSSIFFHLPAPATHTPEDSFSHVVDVHGDVSAANTASTETYWFRDADGGHSITGGAGNDYITVTGEDDAPLLKGNGGDDIIKGGLGNDVIQGDGGDDTIYGSNGDDEIFGGAGHDAMLGGFGDDTFHNIDKDDLSDTNTLDGSHSIIGGNGFDHDTLQLGGLTSFDGNDAKFATQIEELDLKANSAGDNVGTTVTLDYAAVYGITEVGGLNVLTITGDKTSNAGGDHVVLQNGLENWSAAVNDGAGFNVYTAGSGVDQVTVKVQEDITVN